MLKKERQSLIIKELNIHNRVISSNLSKKLKVSEDTIRRDLKELAENGKILKVHGGAISKSFHNPYIHQSEIYAQDAKKIIAKKVLPILKQDMVILTGGGTTMIELAKQIPKDLRATFFTISPMIAMTLAKHENLHVIGIGGELSKNSNVFFGSSVINQLSDLKMDLCLLGANGLSIQEGMTDADWSIVQLKKAMMNASKHLAVLSISEKLDTVQRMKVCDVNLITYLITELPTDHPHLSAYRALDLQLL